MCGAFFVPDVSLVLVAEVAERRKYWVRGCLTESTKRISPYLVGKKLKLLNVSLDAFALRDALKYFEHALRSYFAEGAFSAGFCLSEVEEVARYVDHAVVLVHDDHAAGAHDSAGRGERVIVDYGINVVSGDTAARWAAHLHGLKGLARGGATADSEYDVLYRCAYRDFDKAAVLDFSCEGENLSALALFGADCREGRRPVSDNPADVRERFNVVDIRGLCEKSLVCGMGDACAAFLDVPR